jgi:DNA helicase-2/ATP-dependent DNA helicase PcrA
LVQKLNEELVEEILRKPSKLSEDQTDAVLSKARYNRVIAGAGAGKTETLTRRIVYLILVEDVEPSSIVAFTFTERAAQSMKSRIYQRVGELDESKLGRLGEMYVGTIHAYAKRVLDDYFKFGNYTVLDENQEIAFLMRHGWDIGINEYERNYSESCRVFLRTVNMVWDEMLDRKKLEAKAPDFCEKLAHYEYLLDKHKLLTFGRMILLAVQKLRENPDTLGGVKHLIVDEYQDINRAQEELIRLIGKNGEIFIVGDPRQSIYQWRGSDERFFGSFEKTFKGTQTVTIRENRRSGKRIVANANKFAGTFEKAHYEPMEAIRKEDGFIGLVEHESPGDEAVWIADQIRELVKKRGLKYSDIGVLTRSVSLAAGPLVNVLKEWRVPYIVGGKVGLFKRDEAQALGRVFAWFYERGFWVEDQWKWNEQITGDDLLWTALDCWRSVYRYRMPRGVELRLREIKADLNSKKPSYDNFTSIYQDMLITLGFGNLDNTDPNDATIMANLGRFSNLLTDYETANRVGGRTPHWKEDLKGLCWFMNSYAAWAYEEQPAEDIRGVDAVQIMTVHQAKGLEWPVVFLFSTVDGRFPSKMVGHPLNWCDIPRDLFDAGRYEGDLEDERRLFYVAITRARDALIVSHFKRLKKSMSRSRFIDDLDFGVITPLKKAKLPSFSVGKLEAVDNMLTFSASEITAYLRCPYMYLLRNVYGYQPGLTEAVGFGKGVHYCLRRAVELLKRDKELGPITAAVRAVDNEFFMAFASGDVFESYKKGARRSVLNYAKSYGEDLRQSSEVEYRIEFPIHSATVTGRIDVLGDKEVRDYKTLDYKEVEGSVTVDEAEIQVRLYAAGLKSVGRQVKGGSIAFLSSDSSKVVPVDVDRAQVDKAIKGAERVVESIRNKRFKPNRGEHCEKCDTREICRWRK